MHGFPHGYASGWYQVGWSEEFEPGAVVPLRYLEQDLICYRLTSDNSLHIGDAFCPHFGAHLSHRNHGGRLSHMPLPWVEVGRRGSKRRHSLQRTPFGSTITDGACVLDHDREVGDVRLDAGPSHFGPDSASWNGWFNVTRTRSEHPLRGKLMRGDLVQVLRGDST